MASLGTARQRPVSWRLSLCRCRCAITSCWWPRLVPGASVWLWRHRIRRRAAGRRATCPRRRVTLIAPEGSGPEATVTTPAAWGAALGQREERARTPVQRFWWSEAPTVVAGLSDSKMRRNPATTVGATVRRRLDDGDPARPDWALVRLIRAGSRRVTLDAGSVCESQGGST